MDKLPYDVIAQIGTYLSHHSLKNMRLVSKVFYNNISGLVKRHDFYCNEFNYKTITQNFENTLSNLYKKFPSLNEVVFMLENLPEDSNLHCPYITSKIHKLIVENCRSLELINKFQNVDDINIQINRNLDINVLNKNIHINHLLLDYVDTNLFLKSDVIKNVKILEIHTNLRENLDFSNIDPNITQQVKLMISTDENEYYYNLTFHDLWKVTELHISDNNRNPIANVIDLLNTFIEDNKNEKSRMKRVGILNYYNYSYPNHWMKFVEKMPKNIKYHVGSIYSLNIVPFIDQMKEYGISDVSMYVHNEESYMIARAIQLKYGIDNYPIIYQSSFIPDKKYESIDDVYKDMNERNKISLFWLKKNVI